jgi:hypothetical protein
MAKTPPIFVLGFPRSGTTLLSLMLDSHSQIAIPYESNFIVPYFKERYGLRSLASTDERAKLVNDALSEPFVKKWDKAVAPEDVDLAKCLDLPSTVDQIYTAYARFSGKTIWGDKTPGYTEYVYVLHKMFRSARYVHIVRDGRDVALSLKDKDWGPDSFIGALREWNRVVGGARQMLFMLPEDRAIEVRFEDLVEEPENQMRRITDFLQVPFEPEMLHAYRERAPHKVGEFINDIHVHLREPPSRSQAYKWRKKLSLSEQAIAHDVAGKLLTELGYPPGNTRCKFKTVRMCLELLGSSLSSRFRSAMIPR